MTFYMMIQQWNSDITLFEMNDTTRNLDLQMMMFVGTEYAWNHVLDMF